MQLCPVVVRQEPAKHCKDLKYNNNKKSFEIRGGIACGESEQWPPQPEREAPCGTPLLSSAKAGPTRRPPSARAPRTPAPSRTKC